MRIAVDLGYWTGARSDKTLYPVHRPLYLLDVHWSAYDWSLHLETTRAEHPVLAVVPDVLSVAALPLALHQAETLATCCDSVLIVPKCRVIHLLPRTIGGKPVVLGYSVPSRYGASPLPLWEYKGWPVHLLGGTPLRQLDLARYLDVQSVDGNLAQKLAARGAMLTATGGRAMLASVDPSCTGAEVCWRTFTESLQNVRTLWQRHGYVLEPREEMAA